MLVDSHCHLNYFDRSEVDEIIKQARQDGIGIINNISTKLTDFEEVYSYTEKYENIYCSVGIHPNEVIEHPVFTMEDIITLTQREKVVGIGETGLDNHYTTKNKSQQTEAFLMHIEASRRTNLPLIIHTRDADDDMINILNQEMKKGEFCGVIHCFTGGEKLAKMAIDLGLYISVSGIITFKNSTDLREIVKNIPIDKLLIETDAPFLAPSPYRGKQNRPAYVKFVAEKLAEIKNIELEELTAILYSNFIKLFNL